MELLDIQKRVYAEIDLNALEDNYNSFEKPTCLVVKADAYGHGSKMISSFLEEKGANYFAVSNIEEALELRRSGISAHILILGYSPASCAKLLASNNIEQCVYSLDYANKLNEYAKKESVKVNVHIKIDTGMGRIGFQVHGEHNEIGDAYLTCQMSNLIPVGIFTHFAKADEIETDYTKMQYEAFKYAIDYLEARNIKFKVCHCANSSAILDYKDYYLDMVRAGIALYGVNPSPYKHKLKPVLTLKSVVSHVKVIKKGDCVSYGGIYKAKCDTTIATIPVGYADGIMRSSTGFYVLINGKKCEIVGRVCMDQLMVVTNDVQVGDEVIIYGDGVDITLAAKHNNTIAYTLLCAISRRVPRVYKYNGEIVAIRDELLD